MFPLQHHHFINDLVITNQLCNYGRIDFSLVKLPKLGATCLLHPTCLSSFHRPNHYVYTSNKINGFQILWSDAPLHFLDMLSFWSGITTTTFQTTFHFDNLLLIHIELLVPKYYQKLLVRRQ